MSLRWEEETKKFRAYDIASCSICLASSSNLSIMFPDGIPSQYKVNRLLSTACQKQFLSFVKYKYPRKFAEIVNYLDSHAIRNMPCQGHYLNDIVDILNSNDIKLDIE